jgi:hypothetical protein
MKKRKTNGAAKKRTSAVHSRRKSKSLPLSGPKDPVKRVIPKVAKPLVSPPTSGQKPTEERVEVLPSIFDSQMRMFESMYSFTPLGLFLRNLRLVREDARLQSVST